MKNCPECGAQGNESVTECNCGFKFLENKDYSVAVSIPLKYTKFGYGLFLIISGIVIGVFEILLSFLFFLLDSFFGIICLFSGIFSISSSYGLYKKEYWGYVCFIINLVLIAFNNFIIFRLKNYFPEYNTLESIILSLILIFFSIMSISYLKERKHMFVYAYKVCFYCKEKIKSAAIVCKYCQRDLKVNE